MSTRRWKTSMGLAMAVALAFGFSPDLRAAADAAAQATAKAAAKAAGAVQRAANPGKTTQQKRQLAADRRAAARRAAAKGLKTPGRQAGALATTAPAKAGAKTMMMMGAMGASAGAPHYFSVPNWANSPLPVLNVAVTITDGGGAGTGAAAEVTRLGAAGDIQSIAVTSGGTGYSAPVVAITAPSSGTPATATAVVDPATGAIAAITVTNGGTGYGAVPGTGIRKFVDPLPLTCNPGADGTGCPTTGRYIPIAVPDTTTYPGADYYEIGLVQTRETMHSDLPPTLLREYVQLSTAHVPGQAVSLANANLDPSMADAPVAGYTGVTAPHYLGPLIVAQKDRPVRILFRNLLPTGQGGDLFLPVDTSFMGAGRGPANHTMMEPDPQNPLCGQSPKAAGCYAENRATLHLHGGVTPWISDGTPHQWITPTAESTAYPKGVSVKNVPDMGNTCDAAGSGCMTFYYTNQQSARLLFYHDHSWGITRLNVYGGEAAGYLITDPAEQRLIAGPLAGVGTGLPLVIQDKTFVPDAAQLATTDPLWDTARWGGKGSLWAPHVYMPIQNPGSTEPNPFGRWFYGPWFWPPVSPTYGALPNPYYDANCDPNVQWCEPASMPGTPYVSSGMEAFNDTPIVNGAAYPTITLDPKAYRFRLLNAANDRSFNLQWYVADATGKEVALNAAQVAAALDDPAGISPEPDTAVSPKGPAWIQIGTEGGFLPAPTVVKNQVITYVTDPGRFDVGNVDRHALLVAPAERADVIVDFSPYAGKTLILYNDAPAAFPARDPRYDYYAGNADQRDVGGASSTLPGYGPNTRTVMQVVIKGTSSGSIPPADYYDPAMLASLQAAFSHKADGSGVFESSQHPIVVGQAAYNSAYGTNFSSSGWCNDPANKTSRCDGFVRIFEQGGNLFGFNSVANALQIAADPTKTWARTEIPLQPKGLHDEPNAAAFDEYGRMTANLGLEAPGATPLLQNIILYPYVNPPTELIDGTHLPTADMKVTPIASGADGTQIWKITHNGVDTHPIHFHLYDVQLLNRSPWDGQIILKPDANELGWKDTVRVSPLEDTYVALRPVVPKVPFDLPNSVRLLNPMVPEGMSMGFNNVDPNGDPSAPIVNKPINFGWEYVWHCHILSHEEMDMMRPQSLVLPPNPPVAATPILSGGGTTFNLSVSWADTSLNETSYVLQRNSGAGWVDVTYVASPTSDTYGPPLSYTDTGLLANTTYQYRVIARNEVGYGAEFPTMTALSVPSNVVSFTTPVTPPPAPTNLSATATSATTVALAWNPSAGAATYTIQRRNGTGNAPFTTIASGVTSASFVDTTVQPLSTYGYRVMAVNTGGNSGFSNIASVTTPAAPPNAPSNLALVNGTVTAASVTMTWRDNANNEQGFYVERSLDGVTWTRVATTAANTTLYRNTGLTSRTTYFYRVQAFGATGSSAYSNVLTVTTR